MLIQSNLNEMKIRPCQVNLKEMFDIILMISWRAQVFDEKRAWGDRVPRR
jgi:hypothetical protein